MEIIKKTASITLAVILAFSTIIYLPGFFSYGAVNKDTSWFDDENRLTSYKITTEEQLIGLASLVNEEQTDKWKKTRIESFEGVTFTLMKDIKLTKNWTPIGYDSSAHFSGIFDGNGHTISGMNIKQSVDNAGFFGYLTGEVHDLTIEGKIDCDSSNCGGIAGYLDSSAKVLNCTSSVKVKGEEKIGGIAGYNNGGRIEGCINKGNVKGTYKIGGVVGENWGGSILQSCNAGNVTSTKRGVATYGTGGVAGRSVASTSSVIECYNTGNIKSETEATGGVIGYTNASGAIIKSCYNTGMIRIMNREKVNTQVETNAGGIVGIVGMKGVVIKNCYNTGEIGDASVTGGIIGKYLNESYNKDVFISNNYYVKSFNSQGIGKCQDMGTREVEKATTSSSSGGMGGLAASLGAAFTSEISGSHNNGGAPVLRWQKPLKDEEKTYNANISQELQKSLDKYLVDSADEVMYGKCIMDSFNPKNFLSGAAATYGEIREQLPNIKTPKEKITKQETSK